MTKILHEANSRGLADHGWLVSRHTFSFANYHNPERMSFGRLRVINDDIVKPAMGFGTHPHENMEIISIPLSGSLRHQDSMGNKHLITVGEVQIMSAGSGLTHSEYNNSEQDDVNFLQIWIFPKEKNITPRYGQQHFNKSDRLNRFQPLVSPDKDSGAIWINQDAWLSMADLDTGSAISYHRQRAENGVYFFVIEGQVEIEGSKLTRRDGLGLSDANAAHIIAQSQAEVLCIEVPMH
jgi:redox-sensitive bicupin YhaK (pirin superfamily)